MFSLRSSEKELLDQADIPSGDLFQNLKELDFINHWLGGYRISFSALAKILRQGEKYTLVDIGSGGGDTLKRINKWCGKTGHKLTLFGIDLKPVCIEYAEKNQPDGDIRYICDDFRNVGKHVSRIDIIHASLFCHHLKEEELIELVRFSLNTDSILVINDLERNRFAYYSIALLTWLFSKSYLVKNDAPLSVLRGFKKHEWIDMLSKAGAKKFSVVNRWAFRHEVIVYPQQ